VYHHNPVRINIAGTVDTIAQIDKDLLYRCYNTFYNLNNMVISIAGNFDPGEALEVCDRLLKPNTDIGLQTIIPDEPAQVKSKLVREKLSVGMPLFMIGFKLPNELSNDVKNHIIYNILLEMLLGRSSAFYLEMYETGLINETFNVSVFAGRGYFLCVADGEAREPEKVYEAIKAEIKKLKQANSQCNLCKEEFDRIKKQTYGELLGMFTSAEAVATNMMNAHFDGVDLYANIEAAATVTFDDITAILKNFDEENSCLSIVEN
jgi:predicted Zn-dependent peptidase